MKKYKVMIKKISSSADKKWELLKLKYDPRTGREGLAIYRHINEAENCELITHSLSGSIVNTKIIYE